MLLKKIIRKTIIFCCIVTLLSGIYVSAKAFGETAKSNDNATLNSENGNVGGGYAITGQLPEVGYMSVLYDAKNGLPTSEANCILGLSSGYVLIGGYSGIIRYDGNSFERLSANGGLTNGRGLFEDSLGRVFVGTNDNGVVVIDGDETRHITKNDGLPSSSIRTFTQGKDGLVYIGSTSGVSYVDNGLTLYNVDDKRINNEIILNLVSDAQGNVYGLTKSGKIFSIEFNKVTKIYESAELGISKITAILCDPNEAGILYLGTDSNIVYRGAFGDKVGSMNKFFAGNIEAAQWLSYEVGRIFICGESAVGYFEPDGKFVLIKNLPVNDSISMITSDYQGNIWIASSRQGVCKVIANNFLDYTKVSGIPDEVVNVTCLYKDNLYVGTDKGLKIIAPGHKRVYNELVSYLGDARIRCIFADSKDNLWICTFTYGLGLVKYDKDGNITAFNKNNGMPSNEVRNVYEKSDGSILAGTNNGIVVIKNDEIIKVYGTTDGLNNTVILTVCEGFNGEIYAGTDGDGLYIISDDDVTRIGSEEGLSSDVIMRIRRDDNKGVMWIISSNSIAYMKDLIIKQVSTFPYNNNFDILSDKNDNYWVLSSDGVYSVRCDDMLADTISEYRLYTLANGLTSLPIGHGYSALDNEGNLYIAGQSGVSRVNIEKYFERNTKIITTVKNILCDDVSAGKDASGAYVISSECKRIQIIPAILDYTVTNPTVHVFLSDVDNTGITSELNRLSALEYTGLRYGSYVLHIQILDRGSGKVLSDEAFHIKKEPRFFELIAVRVLLIALLAAGVGLIVWRVMAGTIIRKQYVQIQDAKAEAERANLAKSRFLANMSHEIRTPINTIMGMDEMILRENADGVPKPYFLSVINYALDIRSASESLLSLINDILDISKIESGKMHLVEQEYDIAATLRAIITMIRVRSESKRLFFNVEIDESLPSILYGDEGKIKQIVLNLLTNAVKYTVEGGFTLKVTVTEKDSEKCDLRISVKDTGIGIKKEDLDKLFNAYERLDEEKNSGIQGTGLGLDISRQFAHLMGGNLVCESEYGEGSEFILTVSQKIVDPKEIGVFKEEVEENVKGPYVPQFIAPDADILVVDDNPMNLNVIKGLLKPTKVFVTTAESGEECLEKLKLSTFNVVLLDHMMPGMDGIETLAKIRANYPDLPVYALTANAAVNGEEFYKEKGFTGYLAKPIDTRALERAIMMHLPEDIMLKPETPEVTEEPTDLPDDLKWLYDTEGISVPEGIKHSGGVSSYINSLELFYDTIEDNASVIEKAYNEDDIKLYTIKVHALKSSARIIGALSLSDMCQSLEDAGNSENKAFIDANAGVLLEVYKAFKDKLKNIHKEEKSSGDKQPVPEDTLKEAYEALRELIPQMDYDSVEEILNELNNYALPDKDKELFDRLLKLLKGFAWGEMEELILK